MPITSCESAEDKVDFQHYHHGVHYGHAFGNNDEEHPMTCGLLTVDGGDPVIVTVPTDTFILGLEGELSMEDVSKPGELVAIKSGGIVRIDKGTKIKWVATTGKGFYVTQFGLDHDVKQHLHPC